jgi:hypothetical protein
MIPKHKIPRDRDYLAWAKEQGGPCCLCRRLRGNVVFGDQLHHIADKGMGQKGDDHLVARVCHQCHEGVQGKRRAYFARTGEWEIFSALQEDALALLSAYVGAHA